MENGANRLEEMKMAFEDGASPLESVDGVGGGSAGPKDEARDSEENEIFEEAIEPPQPERSDSQDFAVNGGGIAEVPRCGNGDGVGGPDEQETIAPEKYDEAVDMQVNDRNADEQETVGTENFDGSTDALLNDQSSEKQEASFSEKFDESIDVQVNDQSPEEKGATEMEASAESDHSLPLKQVEDRKETMPTELNGVEADGVISEKVGDGVEVSSIPVNDGELILEDSKEEFVDENSNDGELDAVISDGPHLAVYETPENGGSLEEILDKNSVSCGTDSKEHIPHDDGVDQIQDVSVRSSTFPHEQTVNQQSEEGPSKMDNGFVAEALASVVKEDESTNSPITDGIREHPKEGSEQSPSSDSKSGVIKDVGKQSVLVEGLGDAGSTDDDNKKSYSQQAPSVISHFENSGGTSLPSRPAGLGSSAPLLEPSARSLQQPRANASAPRRQSQHSEEPVNDDAEENDETREKLQMIRVKFLRLAHRLGQTPHNVVVAQVLYRLGLAEQLRRNTNRPGVFSFDQASVMAEQLEAAGQEPLDFSCTIMVIGKTGVGKSATINSIFDAVKLQTDAFQPGTKKVQEIEGMVQGIKVRVIDTPGLSSSSSDQRRNENILHSVKKFISKTPPDIVLYFDRLDMQSRDHGDVPLLRTITDIFGASIWFNAIVVLTHAASAPPDGPNGSPLSYEMFVTQRSHVVQQAIRQAAGDVRLMNPVSLVENHSACRTNRAGQRVLPNGQVWKPQLLLLSFASKILAEANMLLKLQDSPPGKPFGSRARAPPLPFLLSSLLQSRPELKLPEEQFGGDDTLGEDLDEESDSDDETDYDELPPFKRLTKSQLAKLSRAQKKAYFEELDYRERLFYKKQLKEEKKLRKLRKKMAEAAKDLPNDFDNENLEDESSGPASVPVPMPDLVLPTSFDSDNPSHRYRFLDSSSQWLVRPVLETQGWDHDVGYEGLNVERLFIVKDKIPLSVSGQLTKDKKECTLQMELASSIKHGEGKATSLGLDMQSVGKDMAYTLRGETRINNFKRNNTAAGLSVTLLGDTMSAGLKIEDKLVINKRFRLLMSGGAMTGRGDVAYGGRLEATLRDKDYPIGRTVSTLALSVVDWHGDLAIGCNVQSQIPIGRGTNVIGHANLSNRGTGQIGIRLNSSEQLQIALLALVPIFRNVKRMLFGSSQSM
ncbi:translocase of chloroplast 120, chloroplastic [Phoenix dactylifera]|uniref:Translocase of chloroplast 120, chloroplastic n=1 Tax=Phoenix dactylifera TaxID=42345 RepID=A0A8B7BZ79_PHODC|nr:translocase of chloroplast 120, chloroplastic [Phoenix dactylifera]